MKKYIFILLSLALFSNVVHAFNLVEKRTCIKVKTNSGAGWVSQEICSYSYEFEGGVDIGFGNINKGLAGGGSGNESNDSYTDDSEGDGKNTECAGNPVIIASGNKVQIERDFISADEFPLEITKIYNHFAQEEGVFGKYWLSSFDYKLLYTEVEGLCAIDDETGIPEPLCFSDLSGTPVSTATITIVKPDGAKRVMKPSGIALEWHDNDFGERAKVIYSNGVFTFHEIDGYIEVYNNDGQILSRKSPLGIEHQYNYENGNLKSVQHTNGTQLNLVWTNGKLTSIFDSKQNEYEYEYVNNLLGKQIHPDGNYKEFVYGVTNYPGALTQIKVNGQPYANFTYSSATGKALSSAHFSEVDIEKYSFQYSTDKTTVTNPLGLKTDYIYQTINNKKRLTSISREASDFCLAAAQDYTYDAKGFKDKITDWNNVITDYDYDSSGKLIKKVVGYGTPDAVTTNYTWHSVFEHLVEEVETDFLRTNYSYDSQQRLTSITRVNLTNDGNPYEVRTENITYETLGGIISSKRTENARGFAITSTFDSLGNIIEIIDPIGNKTEFLERDSNGNPTKVKSANGLISIYTYDVNNRLKSESHGGRVTSYIYNALGNIDKITFPDGSFLDKSFDDGFRTTGIVDQTGDSQSFTHDLMSNIEITSFSKADIPQFISEVKYDEAGRTRLIKGNNSQYKDIERDAAGRIETVTDAKGNATVLSYDGLGRLETSTDANLAVTEFKYNSQGLISRVQDSKNNYTYYTYNGFGELVRLNSPDTGITTFDYDAVGNLTEKIDANGNVSRSEYDALNRPTISVSGFDMTAYEYDSTGVNNGMLTKVANASGCTGYSYNINGEVTTQKDFLKRTNQTHTTNFDYDVFGRFEKITYPSGNYAFYHYGSNGKLSSISSNRGTVINNIKFKPFGPSSKWSYGNGLLRDENYDLDYRIDSITTGTVQSLGFTYDLANNIEDIENSKNTSYSQNFTYTNLNQLDEATRGSNYKDYDYDNVGNRTADGTNTYNIDSGSNKLLSYLGKTFEYDLNGNIISDYSRTYIYNSNNQLVRLYENNTTDYDYNYLNHRVAKQTLGSTAESFIYNSMGLLLSEPDAGKDYIYFEGKVVGYIKNNTLYYVHNDQLGRPELITNSSDTIVWRSNLTAFDRMVDYSTVGDFNIGFPGQYYDNESGLWYNINRYYDPETGRYTQSDPIGLAGGMNTYAYVDGNPVMYSDPDGLNKQLLAGGFCAGWGAGSTFNAYIDLKSQQSDIAQLSELNQRLGETLNRARSDKSCPAEAISEGQAQYDKNKQTILNKTANLVKSNFSLNGFGAMTGACLMVTHRAGMKDLMKQGIKWTSN